MVTARWVEVSLETEKGYERQVQENNFLVAEADVVPSISTIRKEANEETTSKHKKVVVEAVAVSTPPQVSVFPRVVETLSTIKVTARKED